jgi:hypothetical protein
VLTSGDFDIQFVNGLREGLRSGHGGNLRMPRGLFSFVPQATARVSGNLRMPGRRRPQK